jgi:ubiquinone/menaquinone biosynthesis C-methylase UbiE
MIESKTDYAQEQKLVNEFFDAESKSWARIYQQKDLSGIIHQQRHVIAFNFIDELSLPKTTRVLDIGCGAGFMSVALAKKGFAVDAIDSVPAMIELTQRHAKLTGTDTKVHVAIGDVHELSFEDQSFDLIVALGVTPWLHDLRKALAEIARVLTHGGYVVLTADNRYRLNQLLDPLLTPAFESIRARITRELEQVGLRNPRNTIQPHMYSNRKFDEYIREANLTNLKNTNVGFGPFTLFNHHIFPDQLGAKIHQKLQQYANSGLPILRFTGSQYIVLARKK